MRRYRVAIVERSEIIGEGLRSTLGGSASISVVGIYDSVASVETLVSSCSVDVVVMSLALGHQLESSSIQGAVPIIGIQSYAAEEATIRRFSSVVSIYASAEEIIKAIGETCEQPQEHNYTESHELSERERDVLVLVARGLTNKEIASELNISPHTVMSHRKNIAHKTGIRSVAGLTVYAVLNKLIDSEQL